MRNFVAGENSVDNSVGRKPGRNHEHQPIGHGRQLAFHQDVSLATAVVRTNELVFDTEPATEIRSPGLFREKGIGASLNQAAIHLVRGQYAAETRAGFVNRVLQRITGPAAFFERERCRQPRDTAADNGDAFHTFSMPWRVWLRSEHSRPAWPDHLPMRDRATSANAAVNNRESFSDSARHSRMPSFSVNSLKPMSMSYSTST